MITFQTITSAVSNNFKQAFTGRNDRLHQNPNRFERSPENDTFGYARPRNQESEIDSLDEFFGVAPKPKEPKEPCVIRFDESDCLPRDERQSGVRPEIPDYPQAEDSNSGLRSLDEIFGEAKQPKEPKEPCIICFDESDRSLRDDNESYVRFDVPDYPQAENSDSGLRSLDEIFGEVQPKDSEPSEPKIITFDFADRYPDVEEIPEADIEVIDADIPEVVLEPIEDGEIVLDGNGIKNDDDDINPLYDEMYEQNVRYEQQMQEEYEERRRREQEDLDNELLIYGVGIPAMAIAAGMAFDGCDREETESNNPIIEDDFNNDDFNNDFGMDDNSGFDSGFEDFGF